MLMTSAIDIYAGSCRGRESGGECERGRGVWEYGMITIVCL